MRMISMAGAATAATLLSLLGACGTLDAASGSGPCLDDSQACVAQRTGTVQAMVADPQRKWIGQSVSRTTVASGVRLFAYQNVMGSLSCQQLGLGVREMQDARRTLAGGRQPGQTAERHNQIAALTHDVEMQLTQAQRKRCNGG